MIEAPGPAYPIGVKDYARNDINDNNAEWLHRVTQREQSSTRTIMLTSHRLNWWLDLSNRTITNQDGWMITCPETTTIEELYNMLDKLNTED